MVKRHKENSNNVACIKECEKLNAAISNNIIPEVKCWANKIPACTNDELQSKLIAADVDATQNLSSSV